MVLLVEELTLLDSLKHESGWLEKGNWSKMTWAAVAVTDSAGGAQFPSFGTIGGSYYSAKEYEGNQALAFQRSLGGDISERYWSLWLCYNNSTHSGYRAKFVDQLVTGEGKVIIYKVESGTEKSLGESTAFTLEANDKFAIRKVGKTIEAWRQAKGEGAWIKIAAFADSGTEYTKGFVGMDGSGSDPTFTEFEQEIEGTLLLIGTTATSTATTHEAVAGEIEASQFIAAHTGILRKLVLNPNRAQGGSPGTSIVMGIYADSGGKPSGAPLGEATFASKVINGLMEAIGLKVSLTSGTTYWLVAMPLGGNALFNEGNTTSHTFSATVGHTKLESVTWSTPATTGPLTIAGYGVEVEPPPVIENPGEQFSVENTGQSLQIKATHTTSYKELKILGQLPPGLTLNASTGLITGTIGAIGKPHSEYYCEIEAIGSGGTTITYFWWQVYETTTIISPGYTQRIPEMGTEIKLTSTDVTGASATGLPVGMSISVVGEKAVISGKAAPGTYKIKVTVTGPLSQTAETEFELFISVLWLPIADHTVRDQFPLHLAIGGEDCTFLLAESFTFSNVDPGGYEMASFPIPHDLPWVEEGMHVLVTCGTKVAWEGRVKEIQRSLGQKTLIQCEGYGVATKEQTIQEIYIDQDLTKWGELSLAQELEFLKSGSIHFNSTILYSATGAALSTNVEGAWSGVTPSGDTIYTNPTKIPIGSVHFRAELGRYIKASLTGWQSALIVWENDEPFVGEEEISGSVISETPVEETLNLTMTKLYFPVILMYNTGSPGGTAGVRYNILWTKLAVYGRHGLTKRGSEPGGFYTGDIVKHAVSKLSGLKAGVIEDPTGYIVPQSIYPNPVPVEQVIADMAKLVGCHWGIWESLTALTGDTTPRIDFRPYPEPGHPTAFAWRSECDVLDIREDLTSQYNTAQVTYTEAAGVERTVEVTRDNSILDRAGITKRTITLNLGVSTEEGAKKYGELALKILQYQANVTGQATIKEPIHRIDGSLMAPWMLKSGIDRLRVPDMPCADIWGEKNDLPISRVECSGTGEGLSTAIEFGAGRNLLEVLTSELEQATGVALNG